ncbi:11713_t:CDS:10 [Diversispora eburnea]|uniref:11713_t:CDS:1 n=1 Tax=Diversispora eburnea TaxID=1213867 RepID=A0A9N8UYV1_9GLOM|nr:11713_t:CDS:10 [Diversispora eburnea]
MVDIAKYEKALKSVDQFLVKDLIATNRALNSFQSASLRTSIAKKIELRNLLVKYMNIVKQSNNYRKINEMSDIVLSKGSGLEQQSSSNRRHLLSNSSSSTMRNDLNRGSGMTHDGARNIQFKSSPFYSITEKISESKLLTAVAEGTRNTAYINFRLTEDQVQKILQSRNGNNKTLQIRLFSCAETNSQSPCLIEFPQMCEIHVNDETLIANTRGIKKMIGSVHPIDVTVLCKISSNHENRIKFIYANTAKRYLILLQLVEKVSVESIVEKVKNGRFVSKEEVLRNWRHSAEDDIVLGSSTISLKDPLGYTRIKIPCKSSRCSHIQCFDAYLFFQMNEQVPTWTCPVCNSIIDSWEDIVVDGYFTDILKNTPEDQDSVSIDPNGIWHIPMKRVTEEKKFYPVVKKSRIDFSKHDVFIIDSSEDEEPVKQKKYKKIYEDNKEIIDLTCSDEEEPSHTFKNNNNHHNKDNSRNKAVGVSPSFYYDNPETSYSHGSLGGDYEYYMKDFEGYS